MQRWGSRFGRSRLGFVFAALVLMISLATYSRDAQAQIGIGINITIAPPELPVYDQPPLPAPGYIWIPGYWAWADPDGYYWVPGYWEEPPAVGLLWTPGYWGWHDGVYAWNDGYWGPHVGFYGGVDYGCGYTGEGYLGGRWNNGVFAYNQSVNNFGGVHITNVYNQTVVVNNNITRVSYNGGTGGTTVQPTAQQQAIAHEQHIPPTAAQTQHQQTASTNKALLASQNNGKPTIAAVSKPNQFSGPGVVAAKTATPVNATSAAQPGGTGAAGAGAGANPHALTTHSPNINVPNAVNPNAAKAVGTNSNASSNPNTPKTLGTNAPTTKTLEKTTPGGNAAAVNPTGNLPKTPNTQGRTIGNSGLQSGHNLNSNALPKAQTLAPPHPHIVSAPNPPAPRPPAPHPPAPPHPVAAVHPPAPHPPAAPHPPPAPHPQARPEPHPNNNKKQT